MSTPSTSPIFLPYNTTQNPYVGITSLGLSDPDAHVRGIAERAQEWIERLMSRLVVADIKDRSAGDYLISTLKERGLSDTDLFFITDSSGKSLAQGAIRFMEQNRGILETIGSFLPDLSSSLAGHKRHAQITDMNHNAELALFNISPGSTLIEIWAGDDALRIRALDAHMKSIGGRLICQEQVAASAHWAWEAVAGIPYIPLPNRRELFGPIFDKKDTHVLSMQNVVSSMSLGSIDKLIGLSKDMQAEKIAITQSLAIADKSNLFPHYLRPQSQDIAWIDTVVRLYETLKLDTTPSAMEMSLIVSQAEVTARIIMMELVRKYIQRTAASVAGLKKHRTTLLSRAVILEGTESADYLASAAPHLASLYADSTNKRNVLTYSPFGALQGGFDAKLPVGALKIVNMQFTLECGSRFAQPPSSYKDVQLSQISGETLLTPVLFRLVDEGISSSWLQALPKERTLLLKRAGAAIGHGYIFDLLWKQMRHPILAGSTPHVAAYFYKEFVSHKGLK